jgi:FKBP-type peptidyl-prolyl cis-trans isomerase
VVSQGIKEIQATMEVQTTGNDAVSSPGASLAAPEIHSASQTSESRPSAVGKTSREQEVTEPGLSDQKLPEPDFIASKSLPLGNHNFKSRQDARAFFEENAKQPGVITLPSGLQYRELIAGTGKSPRANDRVVVEYRAFRPDGTETDNSFKQKQPTTFSVETATPALKEALPQMQEGAQWELYIPTSLAYSGVRKRSPYGFEPVIMTVELLSVVAAEPASKPASTP